MGTNYYKINKNGNKGVHLGKRYSLKEGTGFIIARNFSSLNLDYGISDEYGNTYRELEFFRDVFNKAQKFDIYNIGKKFC